MSQIRDNLAQNGATLAPLPTDADSAHTASTDGSSSAVVGLGGPTEAQTDKKHAKFEQDFQNRTQKFYTDFNKKAEDPPGYGANETADGKKVKHGLAAAKFDVPTAGQVQVMNASVGQTKEFGEAVGAVKDAINGEGPVPTSQQMTGLLSRVVTAGFGGSAQATVGASGATGAGTGQATDSSPQLRSAVAMPASLDTGGQVQSTAVSSTNLALQSAATSPNASSILDATPAANGGVQASPTYDANGQIVAAGATNASGTPAAATDAAAAPQGTVVNELPATTSVSALVFLVILQSQQETTKEKNDVLLKIKMFNGMLDGLNDLVNQRLIPAQKEMENLKNEGKDKKNFKAENIQVPVDWPTSIDTNNASMDSATGKLVLNAQWGDGTNSSRQLVDSTGLANLISTADQWRTSIQNNQTQQSNRFQSKDNQMSSAWNILNAVLKNTHDGVSSIVRNI